VPRNLSDLSDLSILVQKNDIMHQMLLDLGREDQIIAVESPEAALRQLANGNHDCALVPKILSRYLISQYGWQNLRVSERTVRAPEYCYGVLNGNDWLLSRFSEGLANLKATGEYRRIYAKWLGPYQERRTEFSDVIEPLLWVVVPAFLLLGAAFVWTRTLRIKVRQSTAELRAEIAERKQAQEQLLAAKVAAEQATRAKSEFLANMSHEIRTPLNGLLGMLQHLESTPLQPEQFEYVETALGSGQRLMGVLNDILDLSRIEAGKMDLERECFDPARVVREVAGIFQANAAAKNIALHCEIEPELPWVLSDEGRLRQILFNLVGNAVKFTEQGEVAIAARIQSVEQGEPQQATLAFEVSDTGIGIPADKLEGLFEPFTQVDGTHARKYGGSGLGLGIVRRLVDLMGGRIDIDSEPDRGTRICFTLPLVVADWGDCRIEDEADPREGAVLGSLNILVAEDERVNRMIIERLLTKQGHQVVAVTDGHHCLQALDGGDFDVILMDIQMPEMDGLETARAIRARDDDKREVPIVALTAHAMKGDREVFLAAGMDDYLSKPVDFNEVSRVLGRVVSASSI
jgi:signal transduction histidine kinase/CheY-like chemotaxis protein